MSDGEGGAARRVDGERVEAPDPGGAVAGVHHVCRTVERQPRAPAPAAHVRAGGRADAVRHAERAVLRVLVGVAHRGRRLAVHRRVAHRVVSLLLHRHVRISVRRHQRDEPHHAHRIRLCHSAAGRHRRCPIRRIPQRPARFRRRVRPKRRH